MEVNIKEEVTKKFAYRTRYASTLPIAFDDHKISCANTTHEEKKTNGLSLNQTFLCKCQFMAGLPRTSSIRNGKTVVSEDRERERERKSGKKCALTFFTHSIYDRPT